MDMIVGNLQLIGHRPVSVCLESGSNLWTDLGPCRQLHVCIVWWHHSHCCWSVCANSWQTCLFLVSFSCCRLLFLETALEMFLLELSSQTWNSWTNIVAAFRGPEAYLYTT